MHNCINVAIDNCFIRTFDDSICVKGFDCYYEDDVEKAVREAMYRNGKSYDVFKNVHVNNCVIWNDWGKSLEIGAETRAEEICDILFENCDIIHVTGVVLDCMNVDYADVHDIVYRNINVEYDDVLQMPTLQNNDSHKYVNENPDHSPYLMGAVVKFHHEYSAGGNRRGKNRNITFENIYLHGRQKIRMIFGGHDEEHQTSNVMIKNFYANGKLVKKEDCSIQMNEFCSNIQINPQ